MKSKIVPSMAVSAMVFFAMAIATITMAGSAFAANRQIKRCNYALASKGRLMPDTNKESFHSQRELSPDETVYEGSREDTGIDANRGTESSDDVDGTRGSNEAP